MHRSFFIPLALVLLTLPAHAQESGHSEGHDPYLDPVIAPLVVPTVDDYAPPAAPDRSSPGGAGIDTYFEITSDQKAGLLTPSYSFANGLALKARIPLIFKRTFHYFDDDASASGLGDISLDLQYTRPLTPGSLMRMQATLKLPTGDDEKRDNDYATPLGTGTTDIFLRGQYARSTARTGLLLGALFRRNSGNELSLDIGGGVTQTITTTLGDQFITSLFGRYAAFDRSWIHLGAVLTILGSGETEITTSDDSFSSSWDLDQDGTLIDLYPGVSYQLGKLQPFLGLRIPVATNYDNEFTDDSRDLALILQFTYRPDRLALDE
jgi:hypothetical protein